MNKIVLLCLIAPIICFSQKIEKNEIDEFKGNHIVETSWESLVIKNSLIAPTTVKYRLSSLDGIICLETKTILNAGDIFQINKGSELIFILENSEKIVFKSIDDGVFGRGHGAVSLGGSAVWGVHTLYTPENNNSYEMIAESAPLKVRLYTDEGFIESDIKKRNYKSLQKSIDLMINL